MRTLDEVIKAYEVCHASILDCDGCPYDNGMRYRDSDCYIADALQWLKGYRGHIELDKLRDKCEAENDPLTWDELKQMEGKPVWVECEYYHSQWAIITGVYDFKISFIGNKLLCSELKEEMGKAWQAYRKERG